MQKLQLYIGTERLELFKDETVSLTQTIQNVKDIKKIFTEFTQTFSIPASKTNNKIFKHFYNFNIDNGYDSRRKNDASIELNGILFKSGKIKLNGVDLKNNVAHTYRITFFGNTVNMKDIISDDQLSSLGDLGQYNQVYTHDEVKDAASDYASGSSDNILVPMISHTDRMWYDSTLGITSVYGNVYYNPSSAPDNGINWNQFKYAIRVQTIIDAIQAEYTIANNYGADIQFSNDFFNDVTNDQFNDLFLWLHRKKGGVETPSIGGFTWSQVNELTNSSSGGFANGIANSSNGVLTIVPNDETVSWTLRLAIIPVQLFDTYSVRVTRQDDGNVWNFPDLVGVQGYSTFASLPDNEAGTYIISIGTTTIMTFATDGILWRLDIEEREGSNTISGYQELSNLNTFTTSPDLQFNIIEQIPKMTIIEFLTGLFQMFNLTAYVDDNGLIIVKTLDSYYAASSEIYNIDQYLDIKKSVVNAALPFKEVNFSYKGLGTILAKQYQQIWNSGWGSLSYTLSNEIYDAPSESYSIQLPFEHMMYEKQPDIKDNSPTTIQYGLFVDDNQESYYGSPLLFYPIRQTSATPIAFRDTNPVGLSRLVSYFIPSNSVSVDPLVSESNIHFNPMVNEWTGLNDFPDTLFETKYKTYIQDVFNKNRRLTKVTAYLPMKIFLNLKLNDIIELGQNKYKINSLKTNLTTGKTDFELLNTVQ